MKRGWNTYTRWSLKYGQLYANEFLFRLDKGSVKRDTIDRLESLFNGMKGKDRKDPAFNRDYRKHVKQYLDEGYIP